MPHLMIQYSAALDGRYDLTALCVSLRDVMVAQGCFPLGGIRVRAWPMPHQAVADGHADNCFVDMILRMGAGRSADVRKTAGQAEMAEAERFFAAELARPHFALALEIKEIEAEMSWKTNSIHPRLKASKTD